MTSAETRSVTDKVLALLAAFDAQSPELTLSELARRAEVSLSTAHRRVAELVEWGALERTSAGRYRVGLRLWEVASLAPRGQRLREVALPFLEDLYVVTRQNVQLAVREGDELVFVERLAGREAVPVMTRVGGRFSLHATGVGLVLLAFAPAEVQERVLSGDLTRYTEHTLTDPRELRRVLAQVRAEGFAVSDRMVTVDALSVAAPVVDAAGGVVAAISLVVLADDAAPVRSLVTTVRTAARGVSRALGMPVDLGSAPGGPPELLGQSSTE
ncbi:IclR family transcriptional regulator [Solicola sp. PLA-1-18]|uniref:IclR family transcriptional regulator n=1 Tax=Solicola sp. PLA-1-18 TaxID=3380532 RepID=UPI003B7C426D